jgi:hypothetical protein
MVHWSEIAVGEAMARYRLTFPVGAEDLRALGMLDDLSMALPLAVVHNATSRIFGARGVAGGKDMVGGCK